MLETFNNEIICIKNSTKNPMDQVKMDFHLHDDYEIYLFLSGGVRYFIEKTHTISFRATYFLCVLVKYTRLHLHRMRPMKE